MTKDDLIRRDVERFGGKGPIEPMRWSDWALVRAAQIGTVIGALWLLKRLWLAF